jgi:hypothetical protein
MRTLRHFARPPRPLLVALLLGPFACAEEPTNTRVNSGTLNGVAFTVVEGELHQPEEDGPIFGDVGGALIVLDDTPAALGMTDPSRLHLRISFALRHGGTITMGAFGSTADPLGPGTAVVIGRNDIDFEYAFYLDSAVFADSAFVTPAEASVEQTVVAEFYAADVPGYGAGSGVAMWPLNDVTPSFGEDVLGCSIGPAISPNVLSGDRVAFGLGAAFVFDIQVVDTILGPCM